MDLVTLIGKQDRVIRNQQEQITLYKGITTSQREIIAKLAKKLPEDEREPVEKMLDEIEEILDQLSE